MQEVIEQVIEAERKGEKILKEARAKGDGIVAKSSEQSQQYIRKAKEQAATLLREASEEAQKQGSTLREGQLSSFQDPLLLGDEPFEELVDRLVDIVGKGE